MDLKKRDSNICCLKVTHLGPSINIELNQGIKKIFHVNGNKRKGG